MQSTPQVTRTYQNHHLDSTRWEVYEPRDDDIIVTTAYKAGTTWTQLILSWLLHEGEGPPPGLREWSPWVDACFQGKSKQELASDLAGMEGRRVLKSHLPLDGLPYYPQVKYLIVGRDARDVFMSFYNHYSNYTDLAYMMFNADDKLGDPLPRCAEDPRVLWRDWMTRGWFEWESEGYPFWGNLAHTQSYWPHRGLPNFLFLHYADMLADHTGAVRRIADFAGIPLDDEKLARTVHETTFATVKKDADEKTEEEGEGKEIFKGGMSSFFFKASNGRWCDVLTDEDLALYEAAKQRVLSEDCATWLEEGGEVPSGNQH